MPGLIFGRLKKKNIIYSELIGREFNVDVGLVSVRNADDSGKSTRKQLRVDFVCNKGSKRYYVQSAFDVPNETKLQQKQIPCYALMTILRRSLCSKTVLLLGTLIMVFWLSACTIFS